MEKEKESYEKITELIIKSVLLLSLDGLIIYKFWEAPIKIENFDYLYFLSTVIALFAITLSVIFYFKSTEQSNKFYDNIFKFTKDTSNILAEMKTGLGHLEKVVYKSYDDVTQENETEKNTIKKENEKIDKETKEVDKEITKLLEDNGVQKETIKNLKEQLFEQSKKYSELEKDKRFLSEELKRLNNTRQETENNIFNYLFYMIRRSKRLTKDDIKLLSKMELRSYANDVIKKEQGAFIRDAEGFSIIKNNEITNIGLFNFIKWLQKNI